MLKLLLIFFAVIYLLGYLGRLFFARWVRNVTGQNQNQNFKQKPEGEVTVENNNSKSRKKGFDDGEYIDYEEIKD